MRWKANKNICNESYLYDEQHNRQYWEDDELNLIACIMNDYEKKIDELESFIQSKEYMEFPTRFDEIIDEIALEFKRAFRGTINSGRLKNSDGWEVKKIHRIDGIKYKAKLTIMEVE